METAVAQAQEHEPRLEAGQNEFLTFILGAEEYAIDILRVQEIRGWRQPTHIASAPPFLKGVINLRGVVVPVVDLRIKFGVGEPAYDASTVVIVLNVGGRVVGVVVDSVSDVITLPRDHIKPAPEFSAQMDSSHITGLGVVDGRMLILIDIEALMLSDSMGLFDKRH